MSSERRIALAVTAVLIVGALAASAAVGGVVATDDTNLTVDDDEAGAETTHGWSVDGVDYDGEVDAITVDYPAETSLDGLDSDDVTVEITRDGESEPTDISVNSDAYDGSQATFDLSGVYNTDIDGPVTVTIDGVENPPAGEGEHTAALTFEGDDTVTTEAAFAVDDAGDVDDVLFAEVVDGDGDALTETDVVVELDGPSDAVGLATTDADGVAELDVPEAGTYDVTVTARGDGTATEPVDIGGTTDETFEFSSAETGAIDALVTDEDGEPLSEGTWVSLTGDDAFGPDRSGQVDEDGTVLIDGVEPGTYDLAAGTITGGETGTTAVTVTADETAVTELTYGDEPTSSTLAGTVSTPEGEPLANETIVLEYDGPETDVTVAETDADGHFDHRRVTAGTYEMAVTAQEFATSDPVTVDAAAGETAEMTLHEVESGTIAGDITDADGDPLPAGTWVSVSAAELETDRTAQVDADGEFLIDGIAPGSYELTAETQSLGETDAVSVDVTADETTTAEFTYGSDDSDVPEDRGEDVAELRFQSETVDDDVVVHGDVEGDVVLAGNTQIDGDILIAGDVEGDVVVRGASAVDRVLVGGDVGGDVQLLGSGAVAGNVTVGSAETVAVRGDAAIDGTLDADDVDDVEVVGSGSIGEIAVDGDAADVELTGGSTVGSVTVAGTIGTFEARGGATVDGTVSLSTAETVELAGGATVGGDLIADEVTGTLAAPDRLVDGEILIEETPNTGGNGFGSNSGTGPPAIAALV